MSRVTGEGGELSEHVRPNGMGQLDDYSVEKSTLRVLKKAIENLERKYLDMQAHFMLKEQLGQAGFEKALMSFSSPVDDDTEGEFTKVFLNLRNKLLSVIEVQAKAGVLIVKIVFSIEGSKSSSHEIEIEEGKWNRD